MSGHGHVQLRLGLYVLGALPATEQAEVKQHLQGCPACLAEHAELSEVTMVLALLSKEDGLALAAEFDPVRSAPMKVAQEPSSRPRTGGVSPRTKLVLAAVMVALVAGVGIGVWLQRPGHVTPIGPAVADTATASGVPATLSVVLVPRSDRLGVRAVVVGLAPGLRFQLAAVTVDGQTDVVYQGVAAGGPQTVVGELNLAPAAIALFTVAKFDGQVLVSVRFSGGFPSP